VHLPAPSPEAWKFWTEALRLFGPILVAWMMPSPAELLRRRRAVKDAKILKEEGQS
jgi:hypothetical protein